MSSALVQQVSATEQEQLQNYIHLFSTIFLYWDYLLTLSDEFRYFWKRPVGVSTVLFFLNRYLTMLGDIVVTISLFSTRLTESRYDRCYQIYLLRTYGFSSCPPFPLFHEILLGVAQLIVCILLAIRIYALYHGSKHVLAVVLSALGIMLTVSIFAIFFSRSEESETLVGGLEIMDGFDFKCHTKLSFFPSVQEAGAWEALFLYDVMLFGMILYKTYQTHHELRPLRIPLVDIIIRDGSLYFGVMALANAVNISTFYYPLPYARGTLSTFASSMSITMMSRLMLNLHKVADSGLHTLPITTVQGPLSTFNASPKENLRGINVMSGTLESYESEGSDTTYSVVE
ncbi:hypothetical protein GYMLUDRAFT_821304 [Collybiopsis luxurians FD-317 M1]|uniref:DUF6533 domain-containing protein n=1 Tax=Collybiopsis luxurians FD-317 M1 TaxID=944289 RepID=A0A0D0CEM0_9AGAR|nr:hypothetical protein GYMLUDRAFT_821304 [Collybiopsis luxurians FD-317 M1]